MRVKFLSPIMKSYGLVVFSSETRVTIFPNVANGAHMTYINHFTLSAPIHEWRGFIVGTIPFFT